MPPSNVKIKDFGLARIFHETRMFRGSYTKVGLPEGEAVASGGSGDSRQPADNVQIGAIHEFGAPKANIPERSWLRSAFDKERSGINQRVDLVYDAVLQGKSTARSGLSKLGEWFTGRVKANIDAIDSPPYAPATVASKRRKKELQPNMLVETAQMRNSVTHVEVMRG